MKVIVSVSVEDLQVGGEMRSMEEIKNPRDFFPRFGPFFKECIRQMNRAKARDPEPCCEEVEAPVPRDEPEEAPPAEEAMAGSSETWAEEDEDA